MSAAGVRRLVLLRHGQTEYNADARMQGQLDTELSKTGYVQAESAAEAMAALSPSVIVSSDLRRAFDTATAVGDRVGLPVQVDKRLRETRLGEWQGMTHTEVDGRFPGARAQWRGDATWAPPGGESRVEVADRSKPVVDELVDKHDWEQGPVLLVAHGGLIAALTATLLDLAVDRWPMLGGLGNAGWVQLSAYGSTDLQWRLDVWNASASVADDTL